LSKIALQAWGVKEFVLMDKQPGAVIQQPKKCHLEDRRQIISKIIGEIGKMKSKAARRIFLTAEGKDTWESTGEYNKKVSEIKRELIDKYSHVLSSEKTWFRRLFIKLRLWMEIRKKIDDLSSWKNLHVMSR
jgi:hypothetical protein